MCKLGEVFDDGAKEPGKIRLEGGLLGQKEQKFPLLLVGVLLLGMGMGLVLNRGSTPEEKGIEILPAEEGSEDDMAEQGSIFVDIAGAVINPGVYELPHDSRLNDLLIAAGGLSAEADREWVEASLNRAQKLLDGVKVYIPTQGEVGSGKLSGGRIEGSQELPQGGGEQEYFGVVQESTGLININTASLEALDTLPGIGEAYAQRIIDYRKAHGSFKSIEEIKSVSGVGDKTFEKIKDKISVS